MLKWLKAKKLPGFTLLELVVVIVVIGILAAVAIPTFSGVITRANDAKAQTTLNAIARDAQALYRFDNGSTPLDWYNAFNEAVSETPVASDYYLASETTLTLTLDLPHGTAQELIDAAVLAASLEGTNPALAGPSASPNQLSIFADPSGDVGMAIASSGNCVFGTIINEAITTWSAKRDLGADCAGSIAFVDPVMVAALEVRDVSEYSNLTVPVAGTLGTPTASNNSISFAVNFTATASAPIDSYEVSRNGTVINATVLAPLNSYTDNTAINGTSYTYSLRAQNSIGYSTSVSTTAATSYAIPQAPGFPIVEALTSQINIGWTSPEITAGSPISGYRLYKSTATGPYLLTATLTPDTQLTYTDTDVVNGTSYSYEVESYGTGGTSTRSTPSAAVTPFGTPVAPATLTAVASNEQVTLTWDEVVSTLVAPVTGYLLQTSPNGTSSWATIYEGALLNYSHTALTNGTDYYYRVAATNQISTLANYLFTATSTATPIAIPQTPGNLTAALVGETVDLSWDQVTTTIAAPVSGYRLYRATSNSGPFTLLTTITPASTTTYTDATAVLGSTYYYQIDSYGAAGASAASDYFPAEGLAVIQTPTTAPTFTLTAGVAQITVNWTAVTATSIKPVTGYTLQRSLNGTSNWTTVYTGPLLTFTDTELTSGTNYFYQIAAYNNLGTGVFSTVDPLPTVTGGTLSSDSTYYYRTFTSSGNLVVSGAPLTADILVIGGGGGGGRTGGGGGAGGVAAYLSQTVTQASYAVVVGLGGAGNNVDGQSGAVGGNSSFEGQPVVLGGGGGGSFGAVGTSGGSGGGGGVLDTGVAKAGGAGSSGGSSGGSGGVSNSSVRAAGGGGGASAAGGNAVSTTGPAGNGGNGTAAYSSWGAATGTGQNVSGTYYYAGGGAGAATSGTPAVGGYGGGGRGTLSGTVNGLDGTDNTGGGGGGQINTTGYNGGSGLVIVRYAINSLSSAVALYPVSTVTGGTLSSDSTYYYRTFTSSGNLVVSGAPLTADILVIAGGGGGGRTGGGGGAGGVAAYLSQTVAQASYAVVVGLGGAGNNVDGQSGAVGGNSSFEGKAAALGGGGGGSFGAVGTTGGSGGGGGVLDTGVAKAGGAGSSGGSSGGSGGVSNSSVRAAGGGGGASAAGGNAVSTTGPAGNGGNGTAAYSSWGTATGTGQNVNGTYYYAGGGGGAATSGTQSTGGYGGGGRGTRSGLSGGVDGTANTGGGGGGQIDTTGYNGGSGLVIVRYFKTAVGG